MTKGKYFSMSEAYDEIRFESEGKRKVLAAAKLIGKGAFNTAKYIIQEGIPREVTRLEKMKKKD